jgi:hypothetical protein
VGKGKGMSKKIREAPFIFGADPAALCDECDLPCNIEEMNLDCYRRLFLQGMLRCSYFINGYCFLIDEPGCVFDNGGRHDTYWLRILNDHFHNIAGTDEDDKFRENREEVLKLINNEIERQNVYLCRYIEDYYNRIIEMGGGLSEDMLSKLDEAYLSLLRGIKRKTD